MTAVRTLIVDDEPAARRGIRLLLESDPEIDVVGESVDGPEALAAIESLRPDLVFLDIQMPGMDGFEVLSKISLPRLPHVVFVTAFDRYAIDAFNVHAVDYLLKPFSDRRFQQALEHAKQQLEGRALGDLRERLADLLERERAAPAERKHVDRLLVRDAERVLLVDTDQVRWIEAKQDYAELHVGDRTYLIRETMRQIQEKLDPSRFVRIHRSTLVNLGEVHELRPLFRGECVVVLHDGTELRLSRRRREALARALGQDL